MDKIQLATTFSTQAVGNRAEEIARKYLIENELRHILSNYRCKCGEIDLIMEYKQILVFVEVRYRKNSRYGSGADTIDLRKRKKLLASATHFLQSKKMFNRFCRFDVISMSETNPNSQSADSKDSVYIDWIQNAFQAQ